MTTTVYLPEEAPEREVKYGDALPDLPMPPIAIMVSSMVVDTFGGHDHVRIWNRGCFAGTLVLVAGDGELLARRHSLVPHKPPKRPKGRWPG